MLSVQVLLINTSDLNRLVGLWNVLIRIRIVTPPNNITWLLKGVNTALSRICRGTFRRLITTPIPIYCSTPLLKHSRKDYKS